MIDTEMEISTKKKQKNNEADITNRNKGTGGTNETYDKNQGNRGKQMQKKPTNQEGKTRTLVSEKREIKPEQFKQRPQPEAGKRDQSERMKPSQRG
jgi:hypothetical protein